MSNSIARVVVIGAAIMFSVQSFAEEVRPDHAPLPEVSVRIHFDSQRHTIEKCNALHAWSTDMRVEMQHAGNEAIGCAVVDTANHACDVYVPEPKDTEQTDRFATIGHETLHCFVGKFHGI